MRNRKWLALVLAAVLVFAVCATVYAAETTGPVAKIGDKEYDTLGAAVADVPTDGTETTIVLQRDASGGGVQVKAGQNIVFDLAGCTYTVGEPTVGSSGTETNGFQLLKDSTVTFKNGTIKASSYPNLMVLIQNYSNLTLLDVTLDAKGASQVQYVASNNCGNVKITGSTSIYAPEGAVAFDVCYFSSYPAVHVTVDTTGTIDGKIEYSKSAKRPESEMKANATLTIKNGDIQGVISNVATTDAASAGISLIGGTYSDSVSVSSYVAPGNTLVEKDGKFEIGVDTAEAVAEVNGKGYMSVGEAIAAASNGDTVKLHQDITGNIGFNSSEDKNIDITLDLNQHTVNGAVVVKKANLTVTNGKIDGAVWVYTGTNDSAYNNLTIEKGVALGDKTYGIVLYQTEAGLNNYGSTIDLYGQIDGDIFVMGNIHTNLETAKNPCVINVHDGAVVESKVGNGIALNGAAIVNIEQGATVAGLTGVEVRAGTLNVNGGTIIGTADAFESNSNSSGESTKGAGIAVSQHTTKLPIHVNITDGKISAQYAFHQGNTENLGSEATDKIDLQISNGEFETTSTAADKAAIKSENVTDFVSGGTFNTLVDENFVVPANKSEQQTGGDKFIIVPDTAVAVAQVEGGPAYETVQEAIDEAAKNGGTVKLLKDVTEDVVVNSGNVTLNLSSYSLTNATATDTITVKKGATLTVTDTAGGVVCNVSHGCAAIFNEGTVVLDKGSINRHQDAGTAPTTENPKGLSNGNSYYTIVNHGDMTINEGAAVGNAGGFSSMIENGYSSYKSDNARTGYVDGENAANPSLTINGGSFTGGLNTVKNDDGGNLKISGGTFKNTAQAAVLNWNHAEITDGDFEVTTNYAVVLNGKDVNNTSGGEVLNKGELLISGGTFKAPAGIPAIGRMNGNPDMSGVEVSGGEFSSEVPEEYCADSFAPQKNANGTYGVHQHTYIEKIDKEPTHTEKGSKHQECQVCGDIKQDSTEEIPAKIDEHTAGTEWKHDENNHWNLCACGAEMNKAAHTYGDWTETTPATEEATGLKERACTVCGYKQTEVIEKLPHTHTFSENWSSDDTYHWHAATCEHTNEISDKAEHTWDEGRVTTRTAEEAAGVKTYTCTVCGKTKTETVPEPEHTHEFSTGWKVDENAHWHECACGEKQDKAAHVFVWKTDKEPTETEAGKKHQECETCGYVGEIAEIPATGKPVEPDNPSTGDSRNPALMAAAMVVSLAGIAGLALLLMKKDYVGKYQK